MQDCDFKSKVETAKLLNFFFGFARQRGCVESEKYIPRVTEQAACNVRLSFVKLGPFKVAKIDKFTEVPQNSGRFNEKCFYQSAAE